MKQIILASASERRSRILSECGIKHKVIFSKAKEVSDDNKHISEIVQINAENKTLNVCQDSGNAVVVGADTLVICDGKIIGKPEDKDDAYEVLGSFSGKVIEVYTGVCIADVDTGKKAVGYETSSLKVACMDKEKIDLFFDFLAPHNKAGGFSIEGVGSILFDDIKGSYFNILGLPMKKVYDLFKELGLNLLEYVEKP